jgi:glutathione S-transferase
MKLKLSFFPTACSIVPYILLKEAKAEFETLDINLGKGEHLSPEYLKINPKGKVPTLIVNGEPLTENLSIQLWIAQTFPDSKLMPKDSFEFFKAVSILSWCSSGIHPKLTQQARPERYCSLPDTANNIKSMGSDSMFELFAMANEMLKGREWFFEHFTCADAYFYWCFRRGAAFGKDQSVFEHCQKHLLRMEQRDSVKALIKHEDEVKLRFNQGS